MADYTSGVIQLEKLVHRILLKSKETTDEYIVVLQHVIDGIREIYMYHDQVPTYQKFTLDATLNSLDYPDDYIDFIALGIPYNGRLWTFTEDKMLVVTTTESGETEVFDADFGEGATVSQSFYAHYGQSGGTNAWYYKKDDVKRRIYVNGEVNTEVVLFYVSSGVNLTSATNIPIKYAKAIEMYVRLQLSMWADEAINIQSLKERQYETELMKVRSLGSWTVDTLYDTLLSSNTQTISR